MSLRQRRIEETATLANGDTVTVSVGVPDDPYIPASKSETVNVELRRGDDVLAAVNTILDPDQESEARALAREIVRGLESGELQPAAGSVEPLANRLPRVP